MAIENENPCAAVARLAIASVFVFAARMYVLAVPNEAVARALTSRTIERSGVRKGAHVGELATAKRWGVAVERASVRLFSTRCVPQCLAGLWLLRALGYQPQARIGVPTHTVANGFAAHVWLELAGNAIIGSDETGQFLSLQSVRDANNDQ